MVVGKLIADLIAPLSAILLSFSPVFDPFGPIAG
jgi:hypothetical protein